MCKQLRHQNWFWIGKNEHKMTILIGKNMIQNYAAAKLGPQEEFILLASVPNSFWIFIFFSDFCLDWGLSISSRLFCHWLFVAGPFSWTQFCKNCLHGICMSKTLLWWVCCPLASSGVLWGPLGSSGVLWRPLASSGVLWRPLSHILRSLGLNPAWMGFHDCHLMNFRGVTTAQCIQLHALLYNSLC